MSLAPEITSYLDELDGNFRSIQKLLINLVALKNGYFPFMLFENNRENNTDKSVLTLKSFSRLIRMTMVLAEPSEKKGTLLKGLFGSHKKDSRSDLKEMFTFEIKFEIQKNLNDVIINYGKTDVRVLKYAENPKEVITVLAELASLDWIPTSVLQIIQKFIPVPNDAIPSAVQMFLKQNLNHELNPPFGQPNRDGIWKYIDEYDPDFPEAKMTPREYRAYIVEEKIREEHEANEAARKAEEESYIASLTPSELLKYQNQKRQEAILNPQVYQTIWKDFYNSYTEKFQTGNITSNNRDFFEFDAQTVIGIDTVQMVEAIVNRLNYVYETLKNIPSVFSTMRSLVISVSQKLGDRLGQIMNSLQDHVDESLHTSHTAISQMTTIFESKVAKMLETSDGAIKETIQHLNGEIETFFNKNIIAKLTDFLNDWDQIQTSFVTNLNGVMVDQRSFHNELKEQIEQIKAVTNANSQVVELLSQKLSSTIEQIAEMSQKQVQTISENNKMQEQQIAIQQSQLDTISKQSQVISNWQENYDQLISVQKAQLEAIQVQNKEIDNHLTVNSRNQNDLISLIRGISSSIDEKK